MRNLEKHLKDQTNEIQKNEYSRASNGVLIGSTVTFAGLFVLLMSFCSPYWIESYEEMRSNFKNMGLWQYCFKDFVYPYYQFPRKFNGCHSVFSQEFYVIREYLLPGWLMSVQLFVILAFVSTVICLSVLSLIVVRWPLKAILQYEWKLVKISTILNALSAFCMLLAVFIFGIFAYRRDWMMYPKFNVLGWSYIFAVVSLFIFGAAAWILQREIKYAYAAHVEQRNLVMQMEMQEPVQGYNSRSFSQARHAISSRSFPDYI